MRCGKTFIYQTVAINCRKVSFRDATKKSIQLDVMTLCMAGHVNGDEVGKTILPFSYVIILRLLLLEVFVETRLVTLF